MTCKIVVYIYIYNDDSKNISKYIYYCYYPILHSYIYIYVPLYKTIIKKTINIYMTTGTDWNIGIDDSQLLIA